MCTKVRAKESRSAGSTEALHVLFDEIAIQVLPARAIRIHVSEHLLLQATQKDENQPCSPLEKEKQSMQCRCVPLGVLLHPLWPRRRRQTCGRTLHVSHMSQKCMNAGGCITSTVWTAATLQNGSVGTRLALCAECFGRGEPGRRVRVGTGNTCMIGRR